ncbi:unnamed protein product, partial [Pylaiella littoralis]
AVARRSSKNRANTYQRSLTHALWHSVGTHRKRHWGAASAGRVCSVLVWANERIAERGVGREKLSNMAPQSQLKERAILAQR